jgi:hypothetical protein
MEGELPAVLFQMGKATKKRFPEGKWRFPKASYFSGLLDNDTVSAHA